MNKKAKKQTPKNLEYSKSFIVVGVISALNIAIEAIILLIMLLALLDSASRDTTMAIIFMGCLALPISLAYNTIMLITAFIAKKFFGLSLQGKLKRYIIVALILSITPACFLALTFLFN